MYGRMDIMRMTDDEIKKIIKEEGNSLPEGVLAIMLDELQKRADAETAEVGLSEEEIAELNAGATENEEDFSDDQPEDEEEEEEEESPEQQIEKLEKEIEEQNKESKRTLIISLSASGAVAIAAVAAVLILKALGKL